MALLYGYLFRVLCVLSILSSCFGNRVEGSHGIGKGIVEGARKPLEGGSVVSEHSAVDENKAVVSTLDRWFANHKSRVIDRFEIGGHVGHGYRVETLHDCVLVYCLMRMRYDGRSMRDARWPLGCRDGQSSPVKEGSASRNRLIEEVAGLLVVLQRVSLDLSEIWRCALSYRFSGLERPRNIGFSVHRCVENLLINSLLVLYYQDRVLVLSPEHQLCYVSDSDAAATAAPNTELSKAISIEMAPRLWPLRIASSSRLARKLRLNSIRRSQETTLKRPERVNSYLVKQACGLQAAEWKTSRSRKQQLSQCPTNTGRVVDDCLELDLETASSARVHKELIQVLALDAPVRVEVCSIGKDHDIAMDSGALTSLSEPSTSSILAAIQSKNALPFKSRIVFSAKMYDRLAKRNERTAACICLRLVVLLRGCRGASKRLSTSCKSLSMLLVRELCVSMPKASLLGDGNCKGWINEASMAVRRTRDVSVGFGNHFLDAVFSYVSRLRSRGNTKAARRDGSRPARHGAWSVELQSQRSVWLHLFLKTRQRAYARSHCVARYGLVALLAASPIHLLQSSVSVLNYVTRPTKVHNTTTELGIMPLDSEHFVMLQSDNLWSVIACQPMLFVLPTRAEPHVLPPFCCRQNCCGCHTDKRLRATKHFLSSILCYTGQYSRFKKSFDHYKILGALYEETNSKTCLVSSSHSLHKIMNHSFTVPCANDLFDSLVREFHILLHTDMVLKAPDDDSSSRLDALVEAGEVVGPILADVTRILGDRLASVTLLEVIPAAKDRECQDQDGNPGDLCSDSSADFGVVQAKSEDECTNDLSSPVEGVVQSSSPRIEVREVKSIELHCIKPIGGEEHREKTNYVWVASDCLPKSHQLRLPGQRSTTSRQDNEADIGSIGDCATTSGVDVLTKGNLSRLPMTAPRLKIIQNQEMYLPLESSGGTCKDVEACVLSVAVAKERSHVDAVTQTTKGQTESDADVVDDTTGKETLVHCVKSNVGLVSSVSRNLTTSAHTRQSIEHARAQEADESDNH
ncbi:MFS general substrate transporter, partial [Aureobasidium melanogenum]